MFFIIIAIFVVFGLVFVISKFALLRTDIMGDHKQEFVVISEKDFVHYCYGPILDDSRIYDTGCLENNFDAIKGLVISVLEVDECIPNNITLIQPDNFEATAVYFIPVYQDNQRLICPGKMIIYT